MEMARPEPKKEEKPKKKSAEDAVRDLERRLQLLGDDLKAPPPEAPPAVAPALPAMADETDKVAPVKGGKKALLARIMAAQERAKQSQKSPPDEDEPPSFSDDLLLPPPESSLPPPSFESYSLPPPQSYPTEAPPPFDFTRSSKKPPPDSQAFLQWAPHVVPPPTMPYAQSAPVFSASAPPPPSAPAFEDLMSLPPDDTYGGQAHASFQPMAPPAPPSLQEEESIEQVLQALEGLSDEEKHMLWSEQAEIMAAIEQERLANDSAIAQAAYSKADAFEQRSYSATVAAIGKNNATEQADMTDEEIARQISDQELAEQLQKEEYRRAEKTERKSKTEIKTEIKRSTVKAPSLSAKDGGWMDWMGGKSSKSSAQVQSAPSTPPRSTQKPGLSAVTTGEELYPPRSNSFNETDANLQEARVADSKPLLNYVTDSITSAVGSLGAQTLSSDAEGNVHGVDSSSLLAVPNVGRKK